MTSVLRLSFYSFIILFVFPGHIALQGVYMYVHVCVCVCMHVCAHSGVCASLHVWAELFNSSLA